MAANTYQNKPTRVLIADNDVNALRFLTEQLGRSGYETIASVHCGSSAINCARLLRPNVVILDADLPDITGVEAAATIQKELIAPAVIIAADVTPETMRNATKAMVFSLLVKPIQIARLIPSLEIAIGQWEDVRRQLDRIAQLRDKEETRDVVAQAKSMLIETQGLSETVAYRFMRELSMSTRRSMRVIAEEILQAAESKRKNHPNRRTIYEHDKVA